MCGLFDVLTGFTRGHLHTRQRPEPDLPELTGSGIQTRPQSHHDAVVHSVQPDEGRAAVLAC